MTLLPENHNGWQREQKCSREAIISKLMDLVSPEPMSGCWLWMGHASGNGYGCLYIDGKRVPAHRASYHAFIDESFPLLKTESGLCACHKCDNPLCVNPAHLFSGTMKDNMLDAGRKGRLNKPTPAACKRGHALDDQNAYRYNDPQGREHVKCRECNRLDHLRAYRKSA